MNLANNPYAPPSESQSATTFSVESLASQPITFRGCATLGDIDAYHRGYEHRGLRPLFLTLALCLLLAAVVFMTFGAPLLIVAATLAGFLIFGLARLSTPLRLTSFQSINRNWDREQFGEIRENHIEVTQADITIRYQWDWFETAVVSSDSIAFVPCLQTHQPLFLSPSMMTSIDGWERLRDVASAFAQQSHGKTLANVRRHEVRALMRWSNRPASIEPASDAIRFSGPVLTSDLADIPKQYRKPNPLYRDAIRGTFVVITAGVLLVAVATSLGMMRIFSLLAIIYFIVFAIRAMRLRRGGQREVAFHLRAFADTHGVSSDFQVVSTFVPWKALRCIINSNERMVLARKDSKHLLYASSKMFNSNESWSEFKELVEERT